MKKVELEDGQSADIVSENISKLKELFPDTFSEGGVNFDILRQLLGDASVLDEGEEKYGLNWHGKKTARQIALTPSTGTLLPCPDESVDWENTQNLFIEGDNLEVLKLLQKSYANKIKMIYIDPPYNTGKEFIYPDRFQENLDTYLKYTGQVDDEGMKFSSNTESTGRKHTNWLNMMYPRLKVARALLKEDGAIFISIDDNELPHLRKLCDEIFGEENFLCNFCWVKRYAPPPDTKDVGFQHENILMYRKSDSFKANLLPLSEEQKARYKNPDKDPRGLWKAADYTCRYTADERPTLYYPIVNPNTGEEIWPKRSRVWANSEEVTRKNLEEDRIWWGVNGSNSTPALKNFLSEIQQGRMPSSLLTSEDVGHTDEAAKEFRKYFTDVKFTVKPTRLIKHFLQIATNSNDIVLDFFAGSGTTADSVVKKNKDDNSGLRFILVQLPEECDPKFGTKNLGIKTISALCAERLRRVKKKEIEGDPECVRDLGFKYFKLSLSNLKSWNPDQTDLEETLLSHEEHLVEGRSEQDVLYELLLKRGVDLAVPIESREVSGKNIYSIGYGVLFACLDESITKEQVEDIAQAIIAWYGELAPSSDTHVFFRDSAFRDDVSKTNMAAILEQNGITHVRSL